jgi:hypothetical protein
LEVSTREFEETNMSEATKRRPIIVAGDITMDWNIARIRCPSSLTHVWHAEDLTCAFYQRGGAAMLGSLIEAVAQKLCESGAGKFDVRQAGAPQHPVTPDDHQFHHSYATWTPFDLDARKPSSSDKAWRVQEFLGLYPAITSSSTGEDWRKVANDPPTADLIVLDDAGLGFRDQPDLWPRALTGNSKKAWILLKMAHPVVQGKLWDYLQRTHAGRLVVAMTINDLRRSQVQITRQVSWERTAQDLMWELLYNPRVNLLTRCAHVVVSFDTAGAILFSRRAKQTPSVFLLYDPDSMEGEWGRHFKGHMVGYTTCLSAGITHEILLNPSTPDMMHGIQSGVSAMRLLHIEGYGGTGSEGRIQLAFPFSTLAGSLVRGDNCLAVAEIRNPAEATSPEPKTPAPQPPRFWTILEDKYPDSLEKIAQRIVLEGLGGTMPEVPVRRFGKLTTVDRREIEALNSISSVIHEYCESRHKSPLSMAVFGPPGSGKSFAVKQVANSVMPEQIEALSFNLSQFGGIGDLIHAFHQVRDRVLGGKIPLVFWDEFDTPFQDQPLGWLRYFLAPMQDGEFQEGQITHPIGQSIFVFAGGTSHSMEEFGFNLTQEQWGLVKLPDFVSRLRGFLNIIGPNRQPGKGIQGSQDPYYIIRRAIILRSIFERNAPHLFRNQAGKKRLNIDPGVLRAFLLVKHYKHGARSMETIINMSQLAGKAGFERSSLPSEAQLDLHVDGGDFFALLQSIELDENILERLAQAAHEVFCEGLRAEGYQYGVETKKERRLHSALRPYSELPEDEKEQSRKNVRDIPGKLASVGYRLLPARNNKAPSRFSNGEVEILARMEHERWMQQKVDTGWQYSAATDKAKKLHRYLIPWEELPADEQQKDRLLVKSIPEIVAKAGYTVVRQNQNSATKKAKPGEA